MSYQRKLDLILVFFIASLILANLMGAKIIEIRLPEILALPLNIIFFPLISLLNVPIGWLNLEPLHSHFFDVVQVSVGIFVFPITFLATDMVSEVGGKREANRLVYLGCAVLVLVMVFTAFAVRMTPAERSIDDGAYSMIFGSGLRITFASLLAFSLSQLHDVSAFHYWKRATNGRFLWLRNNLSTTVSQLIDSCIFMFVAFYHLTPKFTVTFLISLIIPYWVFKVLFAILDTPFCYLGVKWLKGDLRSVSDDCVNLATEQLPPRTDRIFPLNQV